MTIPHNGQVILLAYGPAGATRAALRRVRRIVGGDAAIVVVAATPVGAKGLSLIKPSMAAVAPGIGRDAIRAAAGALAPGPVLVLHDDVALTAAALRRMEETFAADGGVVVPFVPDPACNHHRPVPAGADADTLNRLTEALDRAVPLAGTLRPVCLMVDRDDLDAISGRNLCVPGIRLHGLRASVAPAVVGHSAGCERRLAAPVGPGGRPLLVANIIVRDEQEMLPDCLASLRGVVDRIEVCDTGSVDSTARIAEDAGAHLSFCEWRDDFGWARNQVLERSRDAWFVLWIDADERLECADPVLLRRTLATFAGSVDAISLEVQNVGRNDEDSDHHFSFRTLRIFRATETVFEGTLHEVVRDARTRRPLETVDLDLAGLRHHGYTTETINQRSKRARNLELARAEYERTGGEKEALDYARSLSLAGGDAATALRLIDEALSGAETMSAGGRAHLRGLAGNLALRLGDAERALGYVDVARVEAPGDDLAAAVFAEACAELGRWNELADAGSLQSSDRARPMVTTDSNRRLFDSLVAAARIRCGDLESGIAEAGRVLEAVGEFGAWEELVGALWEADPQATVGRLAPLVVLDGKAEFAEEAAGHLPPLPLAELCAGYLEAGGSGAAAASVGIAAAVISGHHEALERLVGYAGLMPDVAIQRLAHRAERRGDRWAAAKLREGAGLLAAEETAGAPTPEQIRAVVGSWRRLLVEPDGGVSLENLAAAGCRVTSDRSAAPFDAVIAGSLLGEGAEHWAGLLDGGGMLLGWDGSSEDAELPILHIGGGGDAGPVGGLGIPRAVEALEGAGFQVEHFGSLVVGRPPWDEGAVAAAAAALAEPDPDGAAVFFVGEPTPEVVLAVRASLPLSVPIEVVAAVAGRADLDSHLDGIDGARPVMLLDASLVPEPGWVQALWSAFAESGLPSGVGVIGGDGRVIHAGCDLKGRPFGAGAADPNHPVFGADRSASGLLPPLVATAAQLRGGAPIHGRFVGRAWAASFESGLGGQSGPLADSLDRPVLVLADRAADVPRRAVDELVAAGVTPIVRSAAPVDESVRAELGRSGAVVLDGGGLASVAAAFEAGATVYLTERALRDDFPVAAAAHPRSVALLAAEMPADTRLAGRADRVVAMDDLAAEVLRALDTPATETELHPGRIPPCQTNPGVVSVVIPVWNRWELTAACLAGLEAHAEAPLEVIVVDNGSGDETPDRLAEHDVRVITNDENLGFPRAANQGIAAATGEFVCVLNNDTEVTKGWLSEMLAVLEQPGVGMVGPRSNRVSGLQGVPNAPGIEEGEAAARWARTWASGRRGESWPATRLVGFCLLARRRLFEEIGGFDEGFGIGNFEDDELGDRVRRAGLALRVADGSVVLHHGGASFAALETDYAAVLSRAGRHYTRGTRPSSLLTALVLCDGDPAAVRATVASAAVIADRVRVVERAGLPLTELAAADRTEEIIAADWQADGGVEAALEGVADRHVLVCLSGERLEFDDWGRIRARLEALPPGPIEVSTPSGPEVRIHPPEPDGAAAVGSRSETRLDGLRVIR